MQIGYRFNFVTHGQQIRRARADRCADDSEAFAMARVLLRGEDESTFGIEIWSGPRLVGTVTREPTPQKAA